MAKSNLKKRLSLYIILLLVLILSRFIWYPCILKGFVYINPVIVWRLDKCQIDSIKYDWHVYKGYENNFLFLLLGNIEQMDFYCSNKETSRCNVNYRFTFSLDGLGRLKDWSGSGSINLSERVASIISRVESTDALCEIINKNNIKDCRLGCLQRNQENHLIAAHYVNSMSEIFWSDKSGRLYVYNLPWKNYINLPGHANSVTSQRNTNVYVQENDTIITGEYYTRQKQYKFEIKKVSCNNDILMSQCDDGKVLLHDWRTEINAITVDSLFNQAEKIVEEQGIQREYFEKHFRLKQAKALRDIDYRYENGCYLDNSTLWIRFVFRWHTSIPLIDTLGGKGLLLNIYYTFIPATGKIEMVRVGTSAQNMYRKIKFKRLHSFKEIYTFNYFKYINRIPRKDIYIQLTENGDCMIKWGGMLTGGSLNLKTGEIELIHPGAMLCIIPEDVARYGTLDSKFKF